MQDSDGGLPRYFLLGMVRETNPRTLYGRFSASKNVTGESTGLFLTCKESGKTGKYDRIRRKKKVFTTQSVREAGNLFRISVAVKKTLIGTNDLPKEECGISQKKGLTNTWQLCKKSALKTRRETFT